MKSGSTRGEERVWLLEGVYVLSLVSVMIVEVVLYRITGASLFGGQSVASFTVAVMVAVIAAAVVVANIEPLRVRPLTAKVFAFPSARRRASLAAERGETDTIPEKRLARFARASYYLMVTVVAFADIEVIVLILEKRTHEVHDWDALIILILVSLVAVSKELASRFARRLGERELDCAGTRRPTREMKR